MHNIIISDQLFLEPTHTSQAEVLFTAIDTNRPHLSAFLPWVDTMQTVDDLRLYLQNAAAICSEGKEASYAIIYNNKAVGRIGLHYINAHNKSGAIGYWLSKEAEGHGLITRSCQALIRYAFTELGLHRIEIKASVTNYKSQAIPEKLQFFKEGILREAEWVNDRYHDLFLYSLLEEEWKKQE